MTENDRPVSSVPKIEDMPKAPEVFDQIPDDQASLPQPPSVLQTEEIGVSAVDPVTRVVSLPMLAELPPSWSLVIDRVLHNELGINSTLPLLWESTLKRQVERLLVVSPEPLLTYPGVIDEHRLICHAMPAATAEEFVKWLGAQVFIRKQQDQYVECVIHSTTLQVRRAQYNAYIAVPATAKKQVRSTLGDIPLIMKDFPAELEVRRRSRVVLSDPSALLTPIELGTI